MDRQCMTLPELVEVTTRGVSRSVDSVSNVVLVVTTTLGDERNSPRLLVAGIFTDVVNALVLVSCTVDVSPTVLVRIDVDREGSVRNGDVTCSTVSVVSRR